jgi:hypothetical protein
MLMPLLEERGAAAGRVDPDSAKQGSFDTWLSLTANELRNPSACPPALVAEGRGDKKD